MYSKHSGQSRKHVSFLDSQDESGIELFSDFENSTEENSNLENLEHHEISDLTEKELNNSSIYPKPISQPISILKNTSCREKTKWPFLVQRRRVVSQYDMYDQVFNNDDNNYSITEEPLFTFQSLVALCAFIISFTAFCLLTFYPSLFEFKKGDEQLILYLQGEKGIYVLGFIICCCVATIVAFCFGGFSWMIHYFDSHEPGIVPPTPCSPIEMEGSNPFRVVHMGYAISVCNGIAAFFACLTYLGDQYVI